jgi:hypothetical protein
MDLGARTQLTEWARREVARIEALSEEELIIEVTNAMMGSDYSWRSINTRMQRLDANSTVYLDWSSLWSLKKKWESIPSVTCGRQSKTTTTVQSVGSHNKIRSTEDFRVLLVNLKLITARAGLGGEGISDSDYYRTL